MPHTECFREMNMSSCSSVYLFRCQQKSIISAITLELQVIEQVVEL